MMRAEFEKLYGKEISSKEYEVIEFVYTWHPSIDNIKGKLQIADLYRNFGFQLIQDMVETAKKAEKTNSEINKIDSKLEEIRFEIEILTDKKYELIERKQKLQSL